MFKDINEMGKKIKYFIENKQERVDEIIENSFNAIQDYDFSNHLKLTSKEV